MENNPRTFNLYDWSKGIVNRGVNIFAHPTEALLDGENIIVSNLGLETRRGYDIVGTVEAAGGGGLTTRLHLEMDGTDESTTIVDSAGRHSPAVVHRTSFTWAETTGDASNYLYLDTAQKQAGTASAEMAHNNTAIWTMIECDDSSDWVLGGGTGDFEIWFDVYYAQATSVGGYAKIYTVIQGCEGTIPLTSGDNFQIQWYNQACADGTANISVRLNVSDTLEVYLYSNIPHAHGTWYRFCVSRSGSTWTLAADPASAWVGTVYDTDTYAGSFPNFSGEMQLCRSNWAAQEIWVDNLKILWGDIPDGTGQTITKIIQPRFPTSEASYLLVQADSASANKLYISDDQQPVLDNSATFSELFDLGSGAAVIDVAVLNDRCVITEGTVEEPLVFAGALDSGYTDWPHPDSVLMSRNGSIVIDVTNQVCDRDDDQTVNIGGATADGYLMICTDAPKVEAFYITMSVVNSGTSDPGVRTNTTTIDADADVVREDLKATIAKWKNDGGTDTTGHFETSGSVAVTLGAGNTAEDVEVGCEVVTAGGSVWITAITDDGEAADEVTLSGAGLADDTAITAIYGLTVGTGIAPSQAPTDATTLFSETLSTAAGPYMTYSIRQVVEADASNTFTHYRLTFTVVARDSYPAISGTVVDNVGFGKRSSGLITTATPQEVTFSGSSGFSIDEDGDQASDWMEASWGSPTTADDHICIIDFGSGYTG